MLKQVKILNKGINFGIIRGQYKKKKVHINCKEGAQICIRVNKITTQWWPNITIKESKQIILYIYFSFSCYYVHIMLLIWQKNWNCS